MLFFARYPYPESGATVFAIAFHSYLSSKAFCDRFADSKPHACALDELVEFYETLEDYGLLVLGDADARVFAVDVKPIALLPVAKAYVPLRCELNGIGDKVGDNLLYAFNIDGREEVLVWIFDDELQVCLLHTVLKGQANGGEGMGEIYVSWLYRSWAVGSYGRSLKNIVDEALQHIATVKDDFYQFLSFLGRISHLQNCGKA